ncbi:MAG: WYL domain-containing protein [Firmicutes bacterium]|nr:WYL domain-containing protein [Bacillota bacterium]
MSEKEPRRGKKFNQKLKPYLVLEYLRKYSDENNPKSATDIVNFLKTRGVPAERRSIYRDIEDINKVAILMEYDGTDLDNVSDEDAVYNIEDAEDKLFEDEYDLIKLIAYDKHKKGFYIKNRHFDLMDIKLLAECVYSAKFVAERDAKRLVNVVCDFVSEAEAKKIKHDAFLTDRIKTNNKSVLFNISTINEAMSYKVEGRPHIPEKITFKYLKYSIDDLKSQVERRHGEKYKVSPYKLLINDANYYLLAFDDKKQKMMTYRVDRMKDVSFTGEAREGEEEFKKIDLKTYTQRVFSMFGGEPKTVSIRCITPLLDVMVERFGKDSSFVKIDDSHFIVSARVEISDQFFGWLLGFGKKVKLLAPDDVVEKFKAYLDKIRELY